MSRGRITLAIVPQLHKLQETESSCIVPQCFGLECSEDGITKSYLDDIACYKVNCKVFDED